MSTLLIIYGLKCSHLSRKILDRVDLFWLAFLFANCPHTSVLEELVLSQRCRMTTTWTLRSPLQTSPNTPTDCTLWCTCPLVSFLSFLHFFPFLLSCISVLLIRALIFLASGSVHVCACVPVFLLLVCLFGTTSFSLMSPPPVPSFFEVDE